MKRIIKTAVTAALLFQIAGAAFAVDAVAGATANTNKQLPPGTFVQHQMGLGPNQGMHKMDIDKSKDLKLQTMIKETKDSFRQFTYTDPKTGGTIDYNLFIPSDYQPGKAYPMIMFIGDASTVGNDLSKPLTQGYGGVIWATKAEQKKHPSFVLIPQYKGVVIDDHNGFVTTQELEMTARMVKAVAKKYGVDQKRIYSTGQSMGCMITMYLAAKHPDLFAAELLVSGQWDVNVLKPLATQTFFYVAAGGDPKASKGQTDLLPVLKAQGVKISLAKWDAKDSYERLSKNATKEIAKGNKINFATFKTGSVLPAGVKDGSEHMYSFDHVYQIEAIRDWLFQQKK